MCSVYVCVLELYFFLCILINIYMLMYILLLVNCVNNMNMISFVVHSFVNNQTV